MLWIKNKKGWQAVVNRQNFRIVTPYDGDITLSFDIATSDIAYPYLKEEAILCFEDNDFVIKDINRRKKIATITADVDMDAWRKLPYVSFHMDDVLFSEIVEQIMPKGWTIENAGTAAGRESIEMHGATAYEVLMLCKEVYHIVFEYHTRYKKIKVIKPDVALPRGLYMSDELNLNEVEYKGSSKGLITLLQAHGKKTEIKDEEGNVVRTEYVTFKEINDGKDYIENHEYTDKVIAGYWQDDAYEDPVMLYHAAVDRLKESAVPKKSYSCKLHDLSRMNEKYRMLDFKMYDKPILIDASGIHEQHQIVEYTRYPDQEGKNEVVLSTAFQKITGRIEKISTNIEKLNLESLKKNTILNEVIKDVDANTARIKETYTKGEVDTTIASVVQQSVDELNQSIQKIDEDTKTLEKRVVSTEQQLTPEQITNTVSSQFYKKDETDLMYTSKEEVSSQIKQLKDRIDISLKDMSGYNLLYNSSGWNAANFWYGDKKEDGKVTSVIGTIEGIKNNDTSDYTVSGSAFYLEQGSMKQDVRLTPGNTYTLSCKIKRYMSECSLKIIQNGIEITVFSYDQSYIDDEWHSYSHTFDSLSTEATIAISSSAKSLMIADIMLNEGSVSREWTSNNDEIYTGNVKIDKDGIKITQSETGTETIIDSSEFAILYGEDGKKVVRVNKDTTILQKVVAEDDLSVGNVKMLKRDNGLDFVVIEEGEEN